MRQYYRAVRDIARLANRRLDRFESKRSSLFSHSATAPRKLSNSDFSVLHGSRLLPFVATASNPTPAL